LVVPGDTGELSLQGFLSHTEQLLPGDGAATDGGDADDEKILPHTSMVDASSKA
jgi:hypothetical protein